VYHLKANYKLLIRVDFKYDIRQVVEEGKILPLSKGVAWPALLAFSGEKGPKFDKIRKKGYLNAEGRESFTYSVAAPVFTGNGSLAGALVVSGLAARFGEKKRELALKLILEYCKNLKERLPGQDSRR